MIGNTDLANILCHVMSNLTPYLEEWLMSGLLMIGNCILMLHAATKTLNNYVEDLKTL